MGSLYHPGSILLESGIGISSTTFTIITPPRLGRQRIFASRVQSNQILTDGK